MGRARTVVISWGVLTVNSARAPWMARAEKRATETRVEYIVRATCKERSRELKGGGRRRGERDGARMEEEDKIEKGRGLRPRVSLVTRQQRDAQTPANNPPRHIPIA